MKHDPASIYATFAASAARWPERPFVHIPQVAARDYSNVPIELSYAQAASQISHLVACYEAMALGRGHRVGLMLENRAEFFLHYLALNALGISAVPLNREATVEELAHVVHDSGCIYVRALAEHRSLLERVISQVEKPPRLSFDDEPPSDWTARDLPVAASPDEAALLYTSGSTGAPKGCMLSNAYMLVMGRWYCNVGGLCAIEEGMERLATPLPLVHMNALATSAMAMMMSGGCIVQLDRFHPSSWWETIRVSGATIIHYLGVMPAILLQASPSPEDRHHSIKFGFGAGINPKHHQVFEERFGFPLVESWSMTEVGGGAAVIASTEPRHVGERCFGRPSEAVEYRIVDDHGAEVAQDASGELWVRAAGGDPRAGFFSGYNNQPALTEAAWEGGYFHTGDIVRRAADGSLHFVDRKKSIVRRSGENIASLEVEAALSQLPEVRGVGVGPVDDEIRGEEVMASIQLAGGVVPSEATALGIFRAAAERLAYFKVPGYIAFVPELPLTASQKLQRGVLRTRSQSLVDEGRAFDLRNHKKRPGRH
jgi:acyl-CoA synthetase (AMP-forming)/AMP-acid ligase II